MAYGGLRLLQSIQTSLLLPVCDVQEVSSFTATVDVLSLRTIALGTAPASVGFWFGSGLPPTTAGTCDSVTGCCSGALPAGMVTHVALDAGMTIATPLCIT